MGRAVDVDALFAQWDEDIDGAGLSDKRVLDQTGWMVDGDHDAFAGRSPSQIRSRSDTSYFGHSASGHELWSVRGTVRPSDDQRTLFFSKPLL